MLTARYRQKDAERIRYSIDLSRYLDPGVTITALTVDNPDGLIVHNLTILPSAFRSYQYMVSGGTEGRTHRLAFSALLSDGQVRVDNVEITVDRAVEGLYAEEPPEAPTYLPLTSAMRSGSPVPVLAAIPSNQHAAIIDGTSNYDCTTAIQDLIVGMPSFGCLDYGRGRYTQGNVQIVNKTGFKIQGQGAKILFSGNGTANGGLGFQLVGNLTTVEISGLHIVGDGVIANKQYGIYSLSGQNLADIRVNNMRFENVVIGLTLNANLSGSIDGFNVHDIVCENIVGIAAGQGYGVHVAFLNTGSAKGIISNIRANNVQRHAVYVARARDVDLSNIQVINHRANLTALQQVDGTDGWARFRPAIYIARSRHIRATGIRCIDGYDCGLQVGANPNVEAGTETYDIRLSDIQMRSPRNLVPLIAIGESDPSVGGVVEDVSLTDVNLWADYAGAGGIDLLRHYSGRRVTYRGLRIVVKNAVGVERLMQVRAAAEDAGGSTYNDDILLDGVEVTATGTPGEFRGVEIVTSMAESRVNITLKNVESRGSAIAIVSQSTVTNPNYREHTINGEVRGIYTAGDTTPSVARGVTSLVISNASPTTITNFTGGVEGQMVTLMFTDTNTTLAYSVLLRPPGDKDAVSTARLTLSMVRKGTEWLFENEPRDTVITPAQLASASSAVNTQGKFNTRTVIVDTAGVRTIWTTGGSAATAPWYRADGLATVTPV